MIIILAGLELTSNDIHSRMTRSALTNPSFTPGREADSTALPLESMQFSPSALSGTLNQKSSTASWKDEDFNNTP